MTLSDVKIRNLKPKSKPYKVADFDGLYIAVNPSGSKLWRFKYRLDGKEKLLSIGAYPAISLAQARQARDAARAVVAVGDDPSEAKQEEKRTKRESQRQL
jgi:hypothetical protein